MNKRKNIQEHLGSRQFFGIVDNYQEIYLEFLSTNRLFFNVQKKKT